MNETSKNNESNNCGLYNKWCTLEDRTSDKPELDIKEEISKNLNLPKLMDFFDDNAGILHRSRYHKEDFRTHCLLVIDNMLTQYEAGNVSEEAVVAAYLHDIAKPRTAALNKRNEACFYGHENVTKNEVAEFLDPDYPGFEIVLDLIHGHMLPLGVGENTPEPFRGMNQEKLNALLKKHDEQFKKDLTVLSECDSSASIKSDDDLPQVEEKASLVRANII